MAACERYVAKTHRKVFFEYVMLEGVNDYRNAPANSPRSMRGNLYHVNLIPYNTTPDGAFAGTDATRAFGHLPRSSKPRGPDNRAQDMGRDIAAAACGQLRSETQPKSEKTPLHTRLASK